MIILRVISPEDPLIRSDHLVGFQSSVCLPAFLPLYLPSSARSSVPYLPSIMRSSGIYPHVAYRNRAPVPPLSPCIAPLFSRDLTP